MTDFVVLTERDLRAVVDLDLAAVGCMEDAFASLSNGAATMPPVLRLDLPSKEGEVDVKSAHINEVDSFAVKISSGFYRNPNLGLPSTSGMIALLSSETGMVQAIFMDNGYLADVRTAAAGAVASKFMAREDASIVSVLGTGVQAHLQLRALTLVRSIREARIWGRDPRKSSASAEALRQELGLKVTAETDRRAAISGAHVIVTTTSSRSPIVDAAWLEVGQHVTAMGSDAEHKNEIDPGAIALADIYVADSLDQARRLGELHHAIELGLVSPDVNFAELGDAVVGRRGFREHNGQITIADLTGTGVQDTAIARLAYEKATALGVGTIVSN